MDLDGASAATTGTLTTLLPTFDFLAQPQQADELGRLGKYRVLQSIGVGGMGMVFLAEDQKLQRSTVHGLAFLPDGKQALSCGADHKLKLLDVADRSIVRTIAGHTDTVPGVSISPDGKRAASSSLDGTIRVWNLPMGECPLIFKGHDNT